MELLGLAVTLYPLATEGAAVTDPPITGPAIGAFQEALVRTLTTAGLSPRLPVPGTPDLPIIIQPRLRVANAGSRFTRYMSSGLGGAAYFLVFAAVGDANAPFAQFQAEGKRRFSWYGGNSMPMLADAGKLAGERLGAQILVALAAR